MQNRNAPIDWLRAFGILLVVYGHSLAVPASVLKGIYIFHIPLFFFASGFLLTKEKIDRSFWLYARAAGQALIPAYIIFAVVGYLAWALVLRKFGSDSAAAIPITRPLWAIGYGSGTTDDLLQPLVLWFFPALFVGQLLLWGVVRLPRAIRIIAAALCVVGGILLKTMILPFEIESALLAVPFLWLGHEFAQARAIRASLERAPVIVAVLAFAGAMWLGQLNEFVDLRTSQFGNPALFYFSALVAIVSLYSIATRLPRSAGIECVSRATLVIFPLHPLAFAALAAVYVFGLKLALEVREFWWVGIIASAAIVIALTILAPWWLKAMQDLRLAPKATNRPSSASADANVTHQ